MDDHPPARDPESIDRLIERMKAILAAFPPLDPRRHFHSVYLRTTQAVAEEIQTAGLGGFLDAVWVEAWDVAFAQPPGGPGSVVGRPGEHAGALGGGLPGSGRT